MQYTRDPQGLREELQILRINESGSRLPGRRCWVGPPYVLRPQRAPNRDYSNSIRRRQNALAAFDPVAVARREFDPRQSAFMVQADVSGTHGLLPRTQAAAINPKRPIPARRKALGSGTAVALKVMLAVKPVVLLM